MSLFEKKERKIIINIIFSRPVPQFCKSTSEVQIVLIDFQTHILIPLSS